jgi:putative hemolysin
MVYLLLGLSVVVLGLRAIAAGGSAALYAPQGSRVAASLEAGGTAAAVVAAGALALALLAAGGGVRAVVVPVLLVAPLVVLLTDLLPRALAQDAAQVLPAPIRSFARYVLATACVPLRLLETGAVRMAGGARRAIPAVGQVLSELLHREPSEGEGGLSSRQVIRRIFRFRETLVRDVMVPLIHIHAVRDDAPVHEAVHLIEREKISRLPVFHERMYNIIGIVHGRDLLGEPAQDALVTTIMRAPLYVPESKLAHHQLRLMQRRGVNMAVVVDEYGGTVGIVTVEDLLEEIVGEIEDEYDQREVLWERLVDGAVRIEGAMRIDRVNELFSWQLPAGEYDTIAGLVVAHLGRIPRPGARVQLPRVAIEVTRADRRAVHEVIVRPAVEE